MRKRKYTKIKKPPLKVEGNLMFTQRKNPYCDLLSDQMYNKKQLWQKKF